MRTQNLASRRPARACADVAKSQPFNLGKLMYFSTPIRAIVSEGRTQAAVTSPWGRLPETTGLPISRTYRRTKLVLALGTVAFLAACAATPQQEEIVYIDEQASAVSAEPVYTGKYK